MSWNSENFLNNEKNQSSSYFTLLIHIKKYKKEKRHLKIYNKQKREFLRFIKKPEQKSNPNQFLIMHWKKN